VDFVRSCCDSVNYCEGGYQSDYDGNTLTLAAAQYNNLDVLEYFVKERGFLVDLFWRQTNTYAYDINGRSELMHAIANNNLEMVKFLLGRQENGNKKRYSNPRRKAPHSNPALHFKHDARDFARWHKGRIDDKIIKLVEEVWVASGSYENDGDLQRKNVERYKKAFFALNIEKWLKDIIKEMQTAYTGAVNPYEGNFHNLLSVPAARS
jgi:hypothetical protein